MSESELEDQIREEISGIRLHRKRVITPFAHVAEGPLLNALLAITRPAPPKRKKAAAAPPPAESADSPPESLIPKGMVNYRRERYGDIE